MPELSQDIGLCDDCGSDEGRRRVCVRRVRIEGRAKVITVWLCPECWKLAGHG